MDEGMVLGRNRLEVEEMGTGGGIEEKRRGASPPSSRRGGRQKELRRLCAPKGRWAGSGAYREGQEVRAPVVP